MSENVAIDNAKLMAQVDSSRRWVRMSKNMMSVHKASKYFNDDFVDMDDLLTQVEYLKSALKLALYLIEENPFQ